MDNLASSFLKYGDEVLLYSEQMVGFLYSEGWFDQSIYLPKVEKDKLEYYQNFVFIIYPKLSYDATKQLAKMENALGKNEVLEVEDENTQQEAQELAKNKEILEKRCKQEDYYNNRTKRTKYGEFVIYGNEIELIHKASGKIMTIVKNNGTFDGKGGSTLELRDTGRPDKCDFKIMPRYKYRAEGEKIIYRDYFVLYNEHTKNYVYISPNLIAKTEMDNEPHTYRPQMKFRRRPNSSIYAKFTMDMRAKNSSRFQFIPFKHADIESHRFINGGDIVRIKHTEIGGHLCIDGSMEDNQNETICFVRKYRGTDIIEEKDSNCLFEIEMNCSQEQGRYVKWTDNENIKNMDTADLLGLDSDINQISEPEHCNTTFRLRHVNSGQHLVVRPSADKGKLILCLAGKKSYADANINNEYLEETLFTLESQSVDPDERLKPSIVVKVKHVKSDTYISTVTSIDKASLTRNVQRIPESKQGQRDSAIKKYKGPYKPNLRSAIDTDIAKHNLEASKIPKDEDAFVIEQTQPDYSRDCLSIHAAVPILKDYVYDIRLGREERLKNKERMRRIEQFLTDLIFFVTKTEDTDPFT